jgi:hypothetical protein
VELWAAVVEADRIEGAAWGVPLCCGAAGAVARFVAGWFGCANGSVVVVLVVVVSVGVGAEVSVCPVVADVVVAVSVLTVAATPTAEPQTPAAARPAVKATTCSRTVRSVNRPGDRSTARGSVLLGRVGAGSAIAWRSGAVSSNSVWAYCTTSSDTPKWTLSRRGPALSRT